MLGFDKKMTEIRRPATSARILGNELTPMLPRKAFVKAVVVKYFCVYRSVEVISCYRQNSAGQML
jgi:hypothetical protein